MSFSLKNVGATYQCLMIKVLEEQIESSIEAYVDGMVAETLAYGDHSKDLVGIFLKR